jgi:hypothetical protein
MCTPFRAARLALLLVAGATFVIRPAILGAVPADASAHLSDVVRINEPLGIDRVTVSRLSESLQVPFGFEQVDATAPRPVGPEDVFPYRNRRQVRVTGQTLRDALNALTAADPRYSWTALNGVIVIRPVSSWRAADHPFSASVPRVQLTDVTIPEALTGLRRLLRNNPRLPLPEVRPEHREAYRLSIDVPGGTLFDLLNALVVETGGQWALTQLRRPLPSLPGQPVTFATAVEPELTLEQAGLGTIAEWTIARDPVVLIGRVRRPPQEQVLADGTRVALPWRDRLDDPFRGAAATSLNVHTISAMAAASGLSFGFEEVDALRIRPGRRVQDPPPLFRPDSLPTADVRGMTVRRALDALVAADPRYAWRSLDGVVVVRPVVAWTAPNHPLHAATPPVTLRSVTLADGLLVLASALNRPGAPGSFDDRRRFSLNFRGGTALDLVNAIARARGTVVWSLAAQEGPSGNMSGDNPLLWWQPILTLQTPLTPLSRSGGLGVPGVATP